MDGVSSRETSSVTSDSLLTTVGVTVSDATTVVVGAGTTAVTAIIGVAVVGVVVVAVVVIGDGVVDDDVGTGCDVAAACCCCRSSCFSFCSFSIAAYFCKISSLFS